MKFTKLHSIHLFNIVNLIILLVLLLFSIISGYLSLTDLMIDNAWFYKNNNYSDFIGSNLIFFKLIMINIVCYIWGNAFTKNQDSYHLIIKDFYKHKVLYFLAKILLLSIISIGIIYLSFIATSLIGICFTNWYEINTYTITIYSSIILVSLIYGLISVIFTLLIPSNFSFFISPLIFVMGELLFDYNSTGSYVKVFELLFPSVYEYIPNGSVYGIVHLISILFIYLLISLLIYLRKKR